MEFLPSWTKAGSWTLGRDPLGMQATSVRLYRDLIPGMTNVTNRLRYYSFYCWAVHKYEQLKHSNDEAKWRQFIRRAEAVYALACLDHKIETGGIAGTEWAKDQLPKLPSGQFDFRPYTDPYDIEEEKRPKQYLKARRGNFGQFYIASMTEVKLLDPTNSSVPVVSKSLGSNMAEAFSESIADDDGLLENAILKGTIERDDLKKIGAVAHPDKIPLASTEMQLLRDYLLAKDSSIQRDLARRSSAWLILDLFRRGLSNNHDDIRRAVYNRILPDGKPYPVEGKIINHWRAYQANELCHIAFECLLIGMALIIEEFPEGRTPQPLIADFISRILPTDIAASSLLKFAKSCSDDYQGREEDLAKIIQASLSRRVQGWDQEALSTSIKMITALWIRWRDGTGGVKKIISQAGMRSLAGVLTTLDSCESLSVEDAFQIVLLRHIIEDHLAIAAKKLAGSGTFTYHFTLSDGVISDGRYGEYGYTNPRLANLVQFVSDAALYNGKSLTPDGEKFLNGHQPI